MFNFKKILSVAMGTALMCAPLCSVNAFDNWEGVPEVKKREIISNLQKGSCTFSRIVPIGIQNDVAFFSVNEEYDTTNTPLVVAYFLNDIGKSLSADRNVVYKSPEFALPQFYMHMVFGHGVATPFPPEKLPACFKWIGPNLYISELCSYTAANGSSVTSFPNIQENLHKGIDISSELTATNVLGRGMTSQVFRSTLRDKNGKESEQALKVLTTKNPSACEKEISGCELISNLMEADRTGILISTPVIVPHPRDKMFTVVVLMDRAKSDLFKELCKPTGDGRINHEAIAVKCRGCVRGLSKIAGTGVLLPDIKFQNAIVKPHTNPGASESLLVEVADFGGADIGLSGSLLHRSDSSSDLDKLGRLRSDEDSKLTLKNMIKTPATWSKWKERFVRLANLIFGGTAMYSSPEVIEALELIGDYASMSGAGKSPAEQLKWVVNQIENMSPEKLETPEGEMCIEILTNISRVSRRSCAYSFGAALLEAAAKQTGTFLMHYDFNGIELVKKTLIKKSPVGRLSEEDALLFDLIEKLLARDPDKRITLQDAHDHPYFKLYKSSAPKRS